MSKYNRLLTATIGEIAFSSYETLAVEMCYACDASFPTIVSTDAGSHEYQVLTTVLCDKCMERSQKGNLPLDVFSDRNDVDCYRDFAKMLPLDIALKMFKDVDFDSYLKQQGKYEEWHLNNGNFEDKTIQQLKDVCIYLHGQCPEQLKTKESIIEFINTNGPETFYENHKFKEEYYDPHRDLMIDRYREMGSSYFS